MDFKERFLTHMYRHEGVDYETIAPLIDEDILNYLEEPDILAYKGHLILVDYCPESPQRRSLCYDKEARIKRKKNPPKSSVLEEIQAHGLSLVDEEMYLYMQSLDHLDTKTSSYLLTPDSIRDQGGALFGNYKYGRAFIYHNGADSYYAARGFRAYILLH